MIFRVCHFQIRSNMTIEKNTENHLNMYLLLRKNARYVSTTSYSHVSWITCDFLLQLFSEKLSYKMRITNHQSLGDPKFPVKPCTPESTSRRDPKTSVFCTGSEFFSPAIFLVDGVLFCFRILEAEIYQTWNALFMLV